MPRNGTGVFSVINPILIGAVRSSTAVNQNCVDAGDQITNTLPLDGLAGMTGQFKAAPGTPQAPGISFGADRNTGIRRRAPDIMAWISSGQDRFWIDADGKAWNAGAMDIAGDLVVNGAFTGDSVTGTLEAFSENGLATVIENDDEEDVATPDPGIIELTYRRDGHGNVLPPGILGDLRVPFACTIMGATLLADAAGSCVVDVWKAPFANFPPTVENTIVGASPMTLSSDDAIDDTGLSGWTTAIAAGDVLRFNINSISSITRLTVILNMRRFG